MFGTTNDSSTFLRISAWMFLVLFFVYANLLSFIFLKDGNLITEYLKIQSKYVTLFVNFGLIFMIVIENVRKFTEQFSVILILVAFCLIVAIYGHAKCYFDYSENYIDLLKQVWPSYLLQILFLGIVFFLKYKTIGKYSKYSKFN